MYPDVTVGENGPMPARFLRPDQPQPRLTRRNWAFDIGLALLILVTFGSGLAITGELFGTGSDASAERVDPPRPPGWVPPARRVPIAPPAEPPRQPAQPGPPDFVDPALPRPEPPAGHGFDAMSDIFVALAVAPLVVRRRYPLGALWAVIGLTGVAAVGHLNGDMLRVSFYTCVIAAYSAAVYSPFRVYALASLPLAAGLFSTYHNSTVPLVPTQLVPVLVLVPIAIAAHGLRIWRRRADDLKRDQAEAARRAAEEERARIARELHDVVTHNVSMMVIQAGAARKVMDAQPGQAREALLAVEEGGRAALGDLRHVMGLLTAGMDEADLAPQPGMEQLAALVDRVRDTGLPVELAVTGTPRPLPSGIELTTYRVVQEALTNTVKHAAGAAATVCVDYGEDELRIEVTDTGGAGRADADGNGRGLIGLRERLAVYGGTLLTGHRPTGGYRVRALIPLEARPA
jgi:signal transduction histidine kinase